MPSSVSSLGSTENDEISQEDCWTVIGSFFEQKGLVRQQLDSFNGNQCQLTANWNLN